MSRLVLETFGGPGGWAEAIRALGHTDLGIELDEAACATRAAAGHQAIRADVSKFPVEQLTGATWGQCHSPPCTTFSMAGDGAGNAVTTILAVGIRDAFAGRKTRALRRREMAHALRVSTWGCGEKFRRRDLTPGVDWLMDRDWQDAWKQKLRARKGSRPALRRGTSRDAVTGGVHPTRTQRSAKIWAAVRSASLVIEPARFIEAGHPEWTALEQVPSVLPLWEVYADELRKHGYSVWCGKLNAADYGVPQTRERAILIASRVRQVGPARADPLRLTQGHAAVGHAVGVHGRRPRLGRDRPPGPHSDRWRHVHGRRGTVRAPGPGRAHSRAGRRAVGTEGREPAERGRAASASASASDGIRAQRRTDGMGPAPRPWFRPDRARRRAA